MMKHTLGDLIAIVYDHFPRGKIHGLDKEAYTRTAEDRRMVEVRKKAFREEQPFRSVLRRLNERFPDNTAENRSLHLCTARHDGGYNGWVYLPGYREKDFRYIGFFIGFLVPYYVVYGAEHVGGEHSIHFDLRLDEKPFGDAIVEEILNVYPGHELLPPEIGNVIVPDVAANLNASKLGTEKLYDFLFGTDW
jgi:hypothetical protein